MSEAELLIGDDAAHGEAAYVFGPCEAHQHLMAGNYIQKSSTQPGELGMGGVIAGRDPAEMKKAAEQPEVIKGVSEKNGGLASASGAKSD